MTRLTIALMTTATLMMPSSASANDLIKLLRAYREATSSRPVHVHATGYDHPQTSRYAPYTVRYAPRGSEWDRLSSRDLARLRAQQWQAYRTPHVAYSVRYQDSRVPFNVQTDPTLPAPLPQLHGPGTQPPVTPPPIVRPPVVQPPVVQPPLVQPPLVQPPLGTPPPVVHNHGPVYPFGAIVPGGVPLYDCVRIRDRENIACGARPMIVAVKDPLACRHVCDCCDHRVVYVCVMAPPCPPEKVRVSRCGRKVRLDFGKYEIDVTTERDYVKIDYDD